MDMLRFSVFVLVSFLVLSGCTFEEPPGPSPTYQEKTTVTSTTKAAETSSTSTSITTSTGTKTPTSTESTTTSTIYGTVVCITAEDNGFTPEEVVLDVDEMVTFILENRDGRDHWLRNEDLEVNWRMPYKANITREFTPDKTGTFYFNGKIEGMRVKVTVK